MHRKGLKIPILCPLKANTYLGIARRKQEYFKGIFNTDSADQMDFGAPTLIWSGAIPLKTGRLFREKENAAAAVSRILL